MKKYDFKGVKKIYRLKPYIYVPCSDIKLNYIFVTGQDSVEVPPSHILAENLTSDGEFCGTSHLYSRNL